MKIAEIHRCVGCDTESRSKPSELPDGWSEVSLLGCQIAFCLECLARLSDERLTSALVALLREHLTIMPCVGDEVVLLVDGCRGKFKGRKGVVTSADGDSYGIRVPGTVAPGETEEYVGPYMRKQFRLIREKQAVS